MDSRVPSGDRQSDPARDREGRRGQVRSLTQCFCTAGSQFGHFQGACPSHGISPGLGACNDTATYRVNSRGRYHHCLRFVLRMRKLRHGNVRPLAQGFTSRWGQSDRVPKQAGRLQSQVPNHSSRRHPESSMTFGKEELPDAGAFLPVVFSENA